MPRAGSQVAQPDSSLKGFWIMYTRITMNTCKIFAILFLMNVVVVSLDAASLEKVVVQNAAARHAVCNDGTPGVYYFRPGSGEGVNRWVIFLAGGGFCFSVNTCQLRQILNPELMTSSDKPATIRVPGLLSDLKGQNPDFYNANHVAIVYCSSDLFSGNQAASDGTGGYEFRGWNTFRAIIGDLKGRNTGPNLKSASEVLLAGTSAGGAGVMVHLDWLASQLPRAKVRGLNDAGWIPATNSLPLDPPMDSILTQAVSLWNAKPDASCASARADRKGECLISSVYPFVNTPLLVHESQWDSFVLGIAGVDYPFNETEQIIADGFAGAVRSSLGPVTAAFSERIYIHGLAPYTKFGTVKVNNISLRTMLGNFFFDRPGPIKAIKP